jgi:AcrR family transcriptional regulator
MPSKKASRVRDINTEAKIKAAARVVFHKKGFAATRTRDIAEESGINQALPNYYFRSKEKLFELIMSETLTEFLQHMETVFNNEITTLEKKVELFVDKYIDLFINEPEIPGFIMSEIRSDSAGFVNKLPNKKWMLHSSFIKQYQRGVELGKITEPNPLHFLMNLGGLAIYPFIVKPLLQKMGNLNDKHFDKLMRERKKQIPVWVKAMMKAK